MTTSVTGRWRACVLVAMVATSCSAGPKSLAHHTPSATTSTAPTAATTTTTTEAGQGSLRQFIPATVSIWWAVVEGAAAPQGVVVRTVDSGQRWKDVSPPATGGASSDVLDAIDADVAWLEAIPDPSGSTAPLWRTADGGQSWHRVGIVPSDCQLDFVDQVHGWCAILGAAAGSESVVLERTSDGGDSWVTVSRTAVSPASSTPGALPFGCDKTISFTSPAIGWATSFCNGGTAYLDETTDGGSTWHALAPVPLPAGAPVPAGEGLEDPVAEGSDIAVAVEIGGQPGATAVATSSDAGRSWRTQLVPGPRQYWNVDLIDPAHWRFGNGTVVTATDDAGARWSTVTPTARMADQSGDLLTLAFLSPVVGWAFMSGSSGPLWWTTDGGATWTPVAVSAGPYTLGG